MAVQLLSFPFRLQSNGRLATVEQDSDDHVAEELAIIVLSQPGERDLVPDFGVNDPAFDTVSREQVEAQVDLFEVPAAIQDITAVTVDDTRQIITIAFE